MIHGSPRLATATFLILLVPILSPALAQTSWNAVGPDGGDARSLEAVNGDPNHLYLGTANSWIYESIDEGASWHRLARLDASDDLVVDDVVVDPGDPSLIYAAAWKFDRPDGGLWISHDAGKTWKSNPGLQGQSVRAFAQAPSDHNILFAGTLQGVFRSTDAGGSWQQISPSGSKEIHEVESLAVDPRNPGIVYAGTWHLPWKTTDGGKNWQNIKQGVIDDSDVFSIIVDPDKPNIVYASACSGIYKSANGGALFKKIQGIPATARRTRVLRQDPVHRDTVYAGTTEGLYKTTDAGRTFQRMTGPDVIVNDVFVDPKNPDRVLLATDRSGVLTSTDAAVSFKESNHGFSARKVEALLVDAGIPSRVYAGVVNDKQYGGVFVSDDGGNEWKHIAQGLDGRDVFSLAESSDGTVLAGTNSGIFAFDAESSTWKPKNTIANTFGKAGSPGDSRKARNSGEEGKGATARTGHPRLQPGPLRRRLAHIDSRGPVHQHRQGRDMARRAGRGRSRLPFRGGAWIHDGRRAAHRRGPVQRCRADVVADGHSHRVDPHSPGGILHRRHTVGRRARRRLFHPRQGQDLDVGAPPAAFRR